MKKRNKAAGGMIVMPFDGNFYMHKAWFTLDGKEHLERKKLGQRLAYRTLSMICSDANKVGATHLLVAFDGPDVFRFHIYPGYKAGRDKEGKKGGGNGTSDEPTREIYEYLPAVAQYISMCGIKVVQFDEHEADDVLASIAQLPTNVVLGAMDKDQYQNLKPNVCMFYSISGIDTYFRMDDVRAKWKVEPHQALEYQILIGDSGDKVPSVRPGKMGPKTAVKVLKQYGTIANFFKQSKKDRLWMRQCQAAFTRNRKLVTLVKDVYKPKPKDLVLRNVTRLPKCGVPESYLHLKTRLLGGTWEGEAATLNELDGTAVHGRKPAFLR